MLTSSNSSMNYYSKIAEGQLIYPEIAVCVERIDKLNYKKKDKFKIPALTPDMNLKDEPSTKKIIQKKTSIVNKDNNINIRNINISNYLEIYLPPHLFSTRFIEETENGDLTFDNLDKSRYIEVGSKWVVMFIGGDVNKPIIISSYES